MEGNHCADGCTPTGRLVFHQFQARVVRLILQIERNGGRQIDIWLLAGKLLLGDCLRDSGILQGDAEKCLRIGFAGLWKTVGVLWRKLRRGLNQPESCIGTQIECEHAFRVSALAIGAACDRVFVVVEIPSQMRGQRTLFVVQLRSVLGSAPSASTRLGDSESLPPEAMFESK